MEPWKTEIRKKTLKNGATVILIRKPDYVQSFFLCGFGTGGFNVRERIAGETIQNRTGCAHFLEHQMFHYHDEDVSDLFAKMQAQTNAFTSYTETAYYFSTTADIERPLSLLLDFVQGLDITEKTVEKEKGIILSEYAMYDQNPDFRLVKELYASMYGRHPLKYDILGTEHDIEQMSVTDLKAFYARNYDPSRMVIVGITGQELDPVFQHIEEQEEKYPSRIESKAVRFFPEEPAQVARAFYSMEMDVSAPFVGFAYKLHGYETLEQCLKVDTAVSLWLDCVLGPVNPQYQTWLDHQVISQMWGAEADFHKDHGYILFYAQTEKVDAFRQVVESIARGEQEIDPEGFESLKIQALARNIRSLDHFESLAIEMMRAELDGYDYLEWLDLVEELTLDEVLDIVKSLDFSNVCEVRIDPLRD